ncbi:small-conductance mechanosensitive channel [Haloferula luteola]|uniref:Small-conductance mechanosensitive channel n=1 Tax=Haloferula luteola TaxID=595692 RepID=A0A840V2Q9_9BACT|nr:mechanosensitive ion channel family protein [Haloferula luteola]MBB5352275.1 small-conductance mechanosensitive channel [Haloferula luteola]
MKSRVKVPFQVLAFLVSVLNLLLPAHAQSGGNPRTSPPATLEFWNRELVTFRATLAGLTPEERLDTTLKNLRDLPEFSPYQPIIHHPIEAGSLRGVAFEIDGHRLFVLVPADLDPTTGRTLEQEAELVHDQLESLRQAWLAQRSPQVLLRGVLIAILSTAVFAGVLILLRKLGKWLKRLFVQRAIRLRQLKRAHLDLRPVLLILVRRLVGLIVAFLGFSATYLWITEILSLFPFTAPWSIVLGNQLVLLFGSLAMKTVGALPSILVVIVLFFLTRGTVRIVDQMLASFEATEEEGQFLGKDTARATRRIAGLAIWIAGLIIAYPYIPGSDSPAFKGIGVLLGLMMSVGSSGFVNQLMSGFVVLYSGAVRSGEYVRINDLEGTVIDIGLLSTKLLTPKREYITVPNAVIISKETHNYSRIEGESTDRCEYATSVTIGYDAPWRQIHQLLLNAATHTPGIRHSPAPRVFQTALSDYYVEYELRFVPAEPSRKGLILSDLHQRIQDQFSTAGVQIMSPHFVSQPADPVLPLPWPPKSPETAAPASDDTCQPDSTSEVQPSSSLNETHSSDPDV